LPINVAQLDIDFLACSAHKGLLGPTGVGICVLSPLYELATLIEGGTGSNSQSYEQPMFRPDRYEAGTPNLHGIAGTFGALCGLEQRGLLGASKQQLTQILVDELDKIKGVRVYTPKNDTTLAVSFNIAGFRPDQVGHGLEEKYGILCRPGLHCAPAAHQHLRTLPEGTVRFAPGWGTTTEQIETAVRAVFELSQSGCPAQ
jgi:cysteine desulfurase / selenocysteine lyase